MTAFRLGNSVTSASTGASSSSQHITPVLFPTALLRQNEDAFILVHGSIKTTDVVLRVTAN